MTSSFAPPAPPGPGWNPWPAAIIAFFTVAILGFAGFVVFCNLHSSELVAADYYEQELRFQKQVDQRQRAEDLDGRATVKYDAARDLIAVALPSSHGAASGAIELYRPSAAGLDRQLGLALRADGSQLIDARGLQPGLWRVRVVWKLNEQEYQIDQKVVIGAANPKPSTRR
jgi:nitrogen fixation protein FixH